MQLGDGNMKNFDSRTYSINDFIDFNRYKYKLVRIDKIEKLNQLIELL